MVGWKILTALTRLGLVHVHATFGLSQVQGSNNHEAVVNFNAVDHSVDSIVKSGFQVRRPVEKSEAVASEELAIPITESRCDRTMPMDVSGKVVVPSTILGHRQSRMYCEVLKLRTAPAAPVDQQHRIGWATFIPKPEAAAFSYSEPLQRLVGKVPAV